ncbi:MAG TPA: hypothetical protein VD790_09415 [Thermoleophilaceae bacterium]|nr:hypothetical protein [Thermoleophilaceae bacterium]
MPQVQAQRRLVKSPPELWTELSDAAALARHLGEFGEIRITRLEPESKVVWEGDRANGTVELESAGWGTQVTFTVEVQQTGTDPVRCEPEAEPEPEPEPEPVAIEPEPPAPAPLPPATLDARHRRGIFARLFGWDDHVDTVIENAREAVAVQPEDEPEPTVARISRPVPEESVPPVPEPEPEPEPDPAVATLEHALDQLGQAHHRPFSRA